MSVLDKKQMTEEDIKLNFITPAIKAKGWGDKTKHVICANCGSEIYLDSPITEIRSDGNF